MLQEVTLYQKTSKGEIQVWTISTSGASITTTYGLLGGKMQTAVKEVTGKNLGKSNETSPSEQAVLEAQSMIQKKRDKGYFDTIEEASYNQPILPMLAHDWFKHKSKYSDGDVFFVQPKLDGVRCLAQWDGVGNVILRSRGNKEYHLPHIKVELAELLGRLNIPPTVIDGELYNHYMTFNDISGACKKIQESTYSIQYHIYDLVNSTLAYKDRMTNCHYLEVNNTSNNICFVETKQLEVREFEGYHNECVSNGYEGIILRKVEGLYKIGKRSRDLLKYKNFEDAEFKIIGGTAGVGKFYDMVIFRCELDDGSGKDFNVVPVGTEEERKDYFRNLHNYVGKMLTVKFFGRSEDNIPRFPVGKAIRIDGGMS